MLATHELVVGTITITIKLLLLQLDASCERLYVLGVLSMTALSEERAPGPASVVRIRT